MKILLDHPGTNVNTEDDNGKTPLQVACENGYDKSLARMLLERGAKVDHFSHSDGCTVLHFASKNGHVAVAELLLEHGAYVNPYDNNEWTPLQYASYGGHAGVVQLLLERGADANARDRDGWRPIHWAASCHPEFTAMEGRNKIFKRALLQVPSPKEYDAVVIKLLLEHGAWMDATMDTAGESALHITCRTGNVAGMKCLLEHGANTEIKDMMHKATTLHVASEIGQAEGVALLLEYGANVHARNGCETTPLHIACQNNQITVAKLLLEHGGDAEDMDGDGWTPRHWALENGHTAVNTLLLEHTKYPQKSMQIVMMERRHFVWM